MSWKELRKNDEIFSFVPNIWQTEAKLPSWFVVASQVWTRTEKDFRLFVESCDEVWGWFDDNKLAICIYVEERGTVEIAVHLSVLKKLPVQTIIRAIMKWRDFQFHSGRRKAIGWVLQKNTALRKLLGEIGFIDTGLFMDKGKHGKRILRWELLEIKV